MTTLKSEVSDLKKSLTEKETQINTLINTFKENSKTMTDFLAEKDAVITMLKQNNQHLATRNAELESQLKHQRGISRDPKETEGIQEMASCFGNYRNFITQTSRLLTLDSM